MPLKIEAALNAALAGKDAVQINAPNGVGTARIDNIPAKCRITLEIAPQGATEEYGLYLRSDDKAGIGYRLNFSANTQMVSLGNTIIKAVSGLNKTIRVDIILNDDIIDVCIDNRRCIVNRTPEQTGSVIWLYAKHGPVTFKSIKINPVIDNN
jgi:beta-fructofuranosidase